MACIRKLWTTKDLTGEIYVASAICILIIILFIGFYTTQYGGNCVGMRWVHPIYAITDFF